VDGPVGAKVTKLAAFRNRPAGNRSIRTTHMLEPWEIRFLEYRLEVVRSWPESPRKNATIHAILSRLGRASA
jgi:hypothetical protein